MGRKSLIEKQSWKPGNLLSPAPALLVSCGGVGGYEPNLITIAWAGNSAANLPCIDLRPSERYSYPSSPRPLVSW
jgi:hypothetical protein